jgi:transcriptional regulator with XRE-family HTH domain
VAKSSKSPGDDGLASGERSALGAGIRAERLRQQLTLAQVAERAGLTPSALSQIERGVTDPSIGSLRRISSALQVPFFQFLIESDRPSPVVRKADRRRISFAGRDLTYEIIVPSVNATFEFHSLELGPGASSRDTALGHDGDECVLAVQGEVDVELMGELHRLHEGDSIYIQHHLPHRTINPGPGRAEVLVVISPPRVVAPDSDT